MAARDIYLNKFNRRAKFKRDTTTPPRVATAYAPVKSNVGPDIYPLISIHPGNPQITELYILGAIPLSATTPITRLRAAELLSLQKTLKKALIDCAERFTIDGITISRQRAQELLDVPLVELADKFYGLYTIEL